MTLLDLIQRTNVCRVRFAFVLTLVLQCFAASPTSAFAQADIQTTTVTVSSTVRAAGLDRPGINLGGLAPYGAQQLFKSLNYASNGYMSGTYHGLTFPCSAGQNSPTSWWTNYPDVDGYPDNFFVGATFVAINTAKGTSFGSGIITASTTNTRGTGTMLSLSPAISSACSTSGPDVLLVRLTAQNTLLSPNQLMGGFCQGSTWDTSDTSPASTNTQQSLKMPTGCQASFTIDALAQNSTSSTPGHNTSYVPWINLNGSYTATFKAKCLVEGCSMSYGVSRGGTPYVASTVVSPVYNATPGAGWTTYTSNFTASETGAQTTSLAYVIRCSGTCLLQDADVIEGSTLSGNTTVFRDAVVSELERIHPGSLRYMDATQWCSDVTDQIAPMGNRRWCNGNNYLPQIAGPPIGYNDVLALGDVIGSDVWLSVGVLNQASDWAKLVTWLNTSGWTATYAASGHKIYLEDGNEPWNTAAAVPLFEGNGLAYGYTLGLNMAAAKAANGYNSSVVKLVGSNWTTGYQAYSQYGWPTVSMIAAGCSKSTPTPCPDYLDLAPYNFSYLETFDTSGSGVSPTGAPWPDMFAELSNFDSVVPTYPQTSAYGPVQYMRNTYGIESAVYETNLGTAQGTASVNQLQLNQVTASVGAGLSNAEHLLLMQRDSGVTGPMHVFTLAENGNSYNGGATPTMPLWGTVRQMATGPGQSSLASNVDRPQSIALAIMNNAIGSNSDMVSVTQSGTPTYRYAGGQPSNGTNTIVANPAVPYVNCFAYADHAQANWTTICFNNNLSSSERVVLTGVGAPKGSVTQTLFPNANNVITDNNEETYPGSSGTPVVSYPSSTISSGNTYTIPPASMLALTYTSGLPTLATPTFSLSSGTYSGAQAVTISLPSGSTGCLGVGTSPTAPISGTCGAGATTYTEPITVSGSETVFAIATEAGSTNSAVATATYVIKQPALGTTTTLTASNTRQAAGAGFTLKAAMAPSAATGTVTFFDGATALGTAPLSGGVTTYTLASVAAGTHSYTATYAGDATYAGSTSAAVIVTVAATPTVLISTNFNELPTGKQLGGTAPATTVAGSTWTDPNGDWNFVPGGGIVAHGSDFSYPTLINAGTANYTANYTYPAAGAVLLLRYVDLKNNLFIKTLAYGAVGLYAQVNGTTTQLATIWTSTPTAPLTVTLRGANATLVCNGATASAVIPTALLNATQLGFYAPTAGFVLSSFTITATK